MSIKDYLIDACGITEERFDEFAENACRIREDDVPICKELRGSELFELFASYGRANRERRNVDEPYVSEEELINFDQFIGMLRGDIPTPVVCDMDLETRERKRIYDQFIRSFEED